jgi:hypothetical protein
MEESMLNKSRLGSLRYFRHPCQTQEEAITKTKKQESI